MNLPAVFSLIFAALISLLPVLLLMGRRTAQARLTREDRKDESGAKTPPGANSHGAEAQPIIGRLSDRPENEEAGKQPRSQQPRPAREIYTRGQRRATLAQDLRDASRIAGVRRQHLGSIASLTAAVVPSRSRGELLEARLARLSPLQRAVVYSEILGPPAGLRQPGRREEV